MAEDTKAPNAQAAPLPGIWRDALQELMADCGSASPFAALSELIWAIYHTLPDDRTQLLMTLHAQTRYVKWADQSDWEKANPGKMRGDEDLPVVEVKELTEDQTAMLELLKVKRITQTKPMSFYMNPDEEERAKGFRSYVARHECPVVTWRGREWIVFPDGGLEAMNRNPAND